MKGIKIITVIAFSLLFFVGVVSCDKDIDQDLVRRANNESYFDSFADSVGYNKIFAPGTYGDNFVYLKYIKKVEGQAPSPIYTSSVEIRYKKYFLEAWIRNSKSARPFTDNYSEDILSTININSLSTGEAIALQSMKLGEHIRCAIPWYLTIGANGNALLPSPYTALFVDIELVKIESTKNAGK